jgi:hypothetical protein
LKISRCKKLNLLPHTVALCEMEEAKEKWVLAKIAMSLVNKLY